MPPALDPSIDTPGLEVGDRAPNATLINSEGHEVELAELYKSGPVVLTFYRGKW